MAEVAPPKKNRWRSTLIRVFGSIIALIVVINIVSLDDLKSALTRISFPNFGIALFGFMALHSLSALKWRYVLACCGLVIAPRIAMRAYGFGLFANLCLPSLIGGDVIRAGIIIKETENKEAVVFSALVDRLLDVSALFVLVSLGFLAAPTALSEFGQDLKVQKGLIVVGAIFVLIGLIAAPIILRRMHPRKLPRSLGKIWIGLLRAWRELKSQPKNAIMAFLWCLGLQAGFVGVNLFLGESMGLKLDLRLWFLMWPLAKIAAMAPVSLGGIGVREAAFVGLAGSFASKSLLLAQSLVWEATLIVGGCLFGLMSFLSKKSAAPHEE